MKIKNLLHFFVEATNLPKLCSGSSLTSSTELIATLLYTLQLVPFWSKLFEHLES